MMHWQQPVPMDWQEEQQRVYGVMDRRLSPTDPCCAICGNDIVNKAVMGWIEIAPGDPRNLPKVAVHLECCSNMNAAQLARIAVEAVPASVMGTKIKRNPGPVRVRGRKA